MSRKIVKPVSKQPNPALAPPERARPHKGRGHTRASAHPAPYVAAKVEGIRIRSISLRRIDLNDKTFQFRIALQVDDLVESLARDGQQFPVVLRSKESGKYQIISGFRRLAAIRQLRWNRIQAIIRNDLDDLAATRLSVVENEARQTYNDLDRAHAMLACRRMGQSNKEIEKLFHVGPRQRQRLEALTTFPEILKAAVAAGQVTSTNAVRLMQHVKKYPDTDLQEWINWMMAYEPSYIELCNALKKDAAQNQGQADTLEVFQRGTRNGRACVRLRALIIDNSLTYKQRDAIIKELQTVIKYVQEL